MEHPISEAFSETLPVEEVEALKKRYDKTLQGELEEIKSAYRSEMAMAEGSARDLAYKARETLHNETTAAAKRIVWLMTHAEKFETQLKAATFIYEHGVENVLSGENDAMNDLLNKLRDDIPAES